MAPYLRPSWSRGAVGVGVTPATGQSVSAVTRARTVDMGGRDTSDTGAFIDGCSYYSERRGALRPRAAPQLRGLCAWFTLAPRGRRGSRWVIPRGRVSTQCRTSSSRQPMLLRPRRILVGNFPWRSRRHKVVLDSPVRRVTSDVLRMCMRTPCNCMMLHAYQGRLHL